MSKHTPGPWEVGEKDRNEQPTIIARDCLVAVIAHECLASREPVAEANALLIAAAPDLLEALAELVGIVDGWLNGEDVPDSFTTQPARVALAKATPSPP